MCPRGRSIRRDASHCSAKRRQIAHGPCIWAREQGSSWRCMWLQCLQLELLRATRVGAPAWREGHCYRVCGGVRLIYSYALPEGSISAIPLDEQPCGHSHSCYEKALSISYLEACPSQSRPNGSRWRGVPRAHTVRTSTEYSRKTR